MFIFKNRKSKLLGIFALVALAFVVRVQGVQAAACTQPATDYGKVVKTINITSEADYRVWSRMAVPDATNTSYLLDIDGSTCFTVGSSNIPASTAAAPNWTWVDYAGNTTSSKITHRLTVGQHTITMYGNGDGVMLDRVIFTQDLTTTGNCKASMGLGDSCATPINVAPTVSLSASPTTGNAPLSTTLTAVPADGDGTVAKVEFFRGTTKLGERTSAPWTQSITGLTAGSYSYTAKATDDTGAATTSSAVTVTATASTLGNGDTGLTSGKVDLDDLLAVLNHWNQTGKTRLQGDLKNNDGIVNLDDLLEVLNNWSP